jgi:hypothetical protein
MMEKKIYFKPTTKIHSMKADRLLQGITSEEVGPGFEEGAKGGFFDDEESILPRGRNVWSDDF